MNSLTHESETVYVHGSAFVPMLTAEEIGEAVLRLGEAISQDYTGRQPLCLAVLNGAFMFTADLVRALDFDPQLSFIKLSSYADMQSTGKIRSVIGLYDNVAGRDILVIEDIIDTGHTIAYLDKMLRGQGAASVAFATLLYKAEAYRYQIPIDYVGFNIPNAFVIGYGLDYNGYGRTLPGVYVLKTGT